ncbi:MAG: hypothetical protein ACLUR5_07645 [Eubacterium ventriosum]
MHWKINKVVKKKCKRKGEYWNIIQMETLRAKKTHQANTITSANINDTRNDFTKVQPYTKHY